MVMAPVPYFGGKQIHTHWILPVLEQYPHVRYVEPFGGGGSILLSRDPGFDVYNDIYSDIVNFYRVLQDADTFAELTPYAKECFEDAKREVSNETDPVKRAVRWFVVARMSFGGKQSSTSGWKHSVKESRRGVSQCVSSWLTALENLPEVHERLKTVQIENMDAVELVRKYAGDDTLFYLDPPYPMDTRKSGKYHHEFDDEQHRELVKVLLEIPGHKVVSSYESEIYSPLLDSGWTIYRKEVVCNITANLSKETRNRVECLYCSPIPNNLLF